MTEEEKLDVFRIAVRMWALEEAARICDDIAKDYGSPAGCAEAIRALIGKEKVCPRLSIKTAPEISSDLETVTYNGKSARMPRGQMKLMSLLVQKFGHTVTHEAIAYHLWGGEDGPNYERQTVSAQLNTIRKRLKPAGLRVTSVWGTGYRLEPLAAGASA